MVEANFFDYLAFSLQFAPPGPEEKEIRAKLASIGVVPGRKFDMGAFSPEQKAALVEGMEAGRKKIKDFLATRLKVINGWKMGSYFGDRAFYEGNWILRSAGAEAGIYGNESKQAAYPPTKVLPDGTPLDGSKHNYTLTFAEGQYPSVLPVGKGTWQPPVIAKAESGDRKSRGSTRSGNLRS